MPQSIATSEKTCNLGLMVLAHRRPWLLPLIARQVQEFWPDKSVIQVTLDRPTSAVLQAVERMGRLHPQVHITATDIPALAHRENFMRLRNFQLDQLRPFNPRYACIWDDDHILECPQEAKWRMIEQKAPDLVYIRKRFLWDTIDQQNTAIPEHRSVMFFRVRPDDRFPEDRMIHAPAGVHDDPASRYTTMKSTLLDVGYLTPGERERVFAAYKAAGKIDAATLALVSPPQLKPYRPRSVSACHSHEAIRLALASWVD